LLGLVVAKGVFGRWVLVDGEEGKRVIG